MSLPAVELDLASRVFTAGAGRRRRPVVAVEELSMCIAPGEVVGLLGPNGAGKSTVIAMMSGLVTPSSGRVLIEGYDTVGRGGRSQAAWALCSIELAHCTPG